MQKHSVLLTAQNKDLQRELDSFVETDDIVRRNLDRKQKVDEIRTKVDTAIRTSTEIIYQKNTPTKSPNTFYDKNQSASSFMGRGGDKQQRSNFTSDFSPARRGTYN